MNIFKFLCLPLILFSSFSYADTIPVEFSQNDDYCASFSGSYYTKPHNYLFKLQKGQILNTFDNYSDIVVKNEQGFVIKNEGSESYMYPIHQDGYYTAKVTPIPTADGVLFCLIDDEDIYDMYRNSL